ncbi:hypothetical protein ACLE20_06955 [Rhizobium sp. YIM 134829]|uniref:hypothetical protein n=1 Tax=Rhizobium sp. YIM 134829 TaxID=3390453 RepID=UPI00397AB32E
MAESILPVLVAPADRIGMKEARHIAGLDPRTLMKLFREHGIGHQARANAPWVISGPALVLALHGDMDGLEALRAGDRDHPRVRRAIDHLHHVLLKSSAT